MPKVSAVRRIQFCAGHRVYKHESKCANFHGHNYVAFFYARSQELDSVGRVIDFSVLKQKIGYWIEALWDHGFIFNAGDHEAVSIFSKSPMKSYMMVNNPTAENMANYILTSVCPDVLKGTGVEVFKVVLWETENCFSEAKL